MTTLPWGRPLTVADLDTMPEDGHRYELIDGALIVTPAPTDAHQSVVIHLAALLLASCPPDLRVRTAPYDVTLAVGTRVQPDVLVARQTDVTTDGLVSGPLLAVEVLSPSTRRTDLGTKMSLYADAGVASYWVVDPDQRHLRAFELRDHDYELIGSAAGDESWQAQAPFPVTVVPAQLVD
jgi:Uma2 family endonuclease